MTLKFNINFSYLKLLPFPKWVNSMSIINPLILSKAIKCFYYSFSKAILVFCLEKVRESNPKHKELPFSCGIIYIIGIGWFIYLCFIYIYIYVCMYVCIYIYISPSKVENFNSSTLMHRYDRCHFIFHWNIRADT